MRKGTKRYFGKMITSNLKYFEGKELDIVLRNGQCFHGLIVTTSSGSIQMKDGLDGKHSIKIDIIDEIIEIIPAKY